MYRNMQWYTFMIDSHTKKESCYFYGPITGRTAATHCLLQGNGVYYISFHCKLSKCTQYRYLQPYDQDGFRPANASCWWHPKSSRFPLPSWLGVVLRHSTGAHNNCYTNSPIAVYDLAFINGLLFELAYLWNTKFLLKDADLASPVMSDESPRALSLDPLCFYTYINDRYRH